jgi:formylglycine-generating enzyme required for sulfatase activity
MIRIKLIILLTLLISVCQPAIAVDDPPPREGMVFVKGGCFEMGCGNWTSNCNPHEKPVHEVCLDGFYIDKTEVTQKAYVELAGEHTFYHKDCDNCPADNVTWQEADEYCRKAGKRLPTEAEWEYAARSGGKKEKYAGTSRKPDKYTWYGGGSGGTSGSRIHPVGQKKPNGLGLYDMSGNAFEWVADWYDAKYYKKSPSNNPQGPSSGTYRILRGGSGTFGKLSSRTTTRRSEQPDVSDCDDHGFRCASAP